MGLRERKKLETHRALSEAARRLVAERGFDAVTIEDIAEAAGVSVRTFANYFAGKDEAVVGVDPGVLEEITEQLRERPADEHPARSLRAVLLDESEDALRRWRLRNALVTRHPELLPRFLAANVQLEVAVTDAIAPRLGRDPSTDPLPRTLVAATLAAVRAAVAWWEASDRTTPWTAVDDVTFDRLQALYPTPDEAP